MVVVGVVVVVCVWVIFHIIIKLSLEVHQCCTYK